MSEPTKRTNKKRKQEILESIAEEEEPKEEEKKEEEKKEEAEEEKEEEDPKEEKEEEEEVKEEKEEEEEVKEKEREKEEPKEERPTKRIKVTSGPEPVEEPSYWRGAFMKPLILAGLASATFIVNNAYQTTKKVVPIPPTVPVPIKKKEVQMLQAKDPIFPSQSNTYGRGTVAGFTM